MRPVRLAVATIAVLTSLTLNPSEARPQPQVKPYSECGKHYSRSDFHRATRKALRDSRYSSFERRTLKRVVYCQRSARSLPIVRRHLARYKSAWRSRFYWQHRWANVDPGLKARLARLRWCESTGNPTATNGSHWGYFQFDIATWHEAQSYAGVPGRRRTARADYASPIMQNVVTAAFFPGHESRWVCQA